MTRLALSLILLTAACSENVPQQSAADGHKRWSAGVSRLHPVKVRSRRGPFRSASRSLSRPAIAHDWTQVAMCESGGNPRTNTGNGYYGAYQFDLQTWAGVGGRGLPSDASLAEQTRRAELLFARDGAAPWPVCGRYLVRSL